MQNEKGIQKREDRKGESEIGTQKREKGKEKSNVKGMQKMRKGRWKEDMEKECKRE